MLLLVQTADAMNCTIVVAQSVCPSVCPRYQHNIIAAGASGALPRSDFSCRHFATFCVVWFCCRFWTRISLRNRQTNGRTDRQTDRQTNSAPHRARQTIRHIYHNEHRVASLESGPDLLSHPSSTRLNPTRRRTVDCPSAHRGLVTDRRPPTKPATHTRAPQQIT